MIYNVVTVKEETKQKNKKEKEKRIMKNYKDYGKVNIGSSDIAALIMAGGGQKNPSWLLFGEDGSYSAYIVDENAAIGEHYKEIIQFDFWMKIYDDDGLTRHFHADKIKVFRAGEFGCIIQLIGDKDGLCG